MTKQDSNPETMGGILITSGLGVGLTDEELQQVAALTVEQELTKGARVLEEGSHSRDLYVIQHGEVSVRVNLTVICILEEIVAKLNDHEVFGEFAFVSGEPRSASIQAESRVTVLQIRYDSLMDLFAKSPSIGYKMMRNIAVIITKRMAENNRKMRKLLFYN